MVSSLRNRLALVVLLGAMVLPALSGNLRGLTHVLVCEEAVEQPFSVELSTDGSVVVASSMVIDPGDETTTVCGGLVVDLRASVDGDHLNLDVVLQNSTSDPWAGTVGLKVDTPAIEVVVPASAGRVDPGSTAVSSLVIRLSEGVTDIDGTLLLGP